MDGGNDYLIQVKGNHKYLHNASKEHIKQNQPISACRTKDKKRGRIENRQIEVYPVQSQEHEVFSQWCEIKTIIHVRRWGYRKSKIKSKKYFNHNYYISSLNIKDAEYYAKGIRDHWNIENRLHWVKDVILNEDKNRIKTGSIARNMSIIKSIMMNVYRSNGYDSIKFAMEVFANKPKESLLLISK